MNQEVQTQQQEIRALAWTVGIPDKDDIAKILHEYKSLNFPSSGAVLDQTHQKLQSMVHGALSRRYVSPTL